MKRSSMTKVNHPKFFRPGSQKRRQRQGAVAMVADTDTAAVIDRLQAFALGSDGNAMSEPQVAAACELLNRVLPDLHRIELRVAGGQPILVTVAEAAAGDECEHKIAID